MLVHTGTEELGHMELLATAVAMNLDGVTDDTIDEIVREPVVAARIGGMDPRHFLSVGLAALPAEANGVRSTPIASTPATTTANLRANVAAEESAARWPPGYATGWMTKA